MHVDGQYVNELFDISFSDPSRADGGVSFSVCCFPDVCVLVCWPQPVWEVRSQKEAFLCVCGDGQCVVWCGP